MNNIKLFISTNETVVFGDLGLRTFTHPAVDYEITLEYTFEELFSSVDFKNHLDAGAFILKDEYGNTITTSDQMYQASMIPKAVKQVKVAGETINAYRAVILENNLVYLFDNTNVNHYGRIIGISNNTANIGEMVQIISEGEKINGMVLEPNKIYYAIGEGILTSTMPIMNVRQIIGVALSVDTLMIKINKPIKLT